MKSKQNIFYIVILILVLATVAFAVVKFAKPKSNNANNPSASASANASRTRGSGQGFNRGNFKPIHGVVLSVNGQTIIMKADDGSSKNITCSDSTRISKQDNGQRVSLTLADIKVNDEINVMSSDTAGSDITPRMIIIGTFSPPQNSNFQSPSGGSSI